MLKGILSIAGQPGLYKLVAEAKNRIIVESLTTGKRLPASTTSKISSLEDIAVYTLSGEVLLKEVLKKISDLEEGGPAPDPKMPDDKIRSYFGSILPDYDKEKVYLSDIRKILLWYNTLRDKELLTFEEEESLETPAQENPTPAE